MDQPENPHAPHPTELPDSPDPPRSGVTRRAFIKGVIASGAVASSAAYLFRSSGEIFGQTSAPGSVERLITLNVNGQLRRVDVMKQETLAMTLRYKLGSPARRSAATAPNAARAPCSSTMCRTTRARCSRTRCADGRCRRSKGSPAATAAASGAAGGRRRAGLPVRVLHAGLRDGRGRLPQDEPESDAPGARARHLGQPVPLPGLRQDPHRPHARR